MLTALISIHSPRMGRDRYVEGTIYYKDQFQSTLPAWGETVGVTGAAISRIISIHSPRMGRDPLFRSLRRLLDISIHSPRMGRD